MSETEKNKINSWLMIWDGPAQTEKILHVPGHNRCFKCKFLCLASSMSLQMQREVIGTSKSTLAGIAFERASSSMLSVVPC